MCVGGVGGGRYAESRWTLKCYMSSPSLSVNSPIYYTSGTPFVHASPKLYRVCPCGSGCAAGLQRAADPHLQQAWGGSAARRPPPRASGTAQCAAAGGFPGGPGHGRWGGPAPQPAHHRLPQRPGRAKEKTHTITILTYVFLHIFYVCISIVWLVLWHPHSPVSVFLSPAGRSLSDPSFLNASRKY